MSGGHVDDAMLLKLSTGSLGDAAREEARRHVDQCPRCKGVLASFSEDTAPQGRPLPRERTQASDPLIGQTLGEYRVVERLGQGAMGVLYRGEQPVIGKMVAIKVLLPTIAADPVVVERMIREAQAVNAIGHPNIVDIFSFGKLPDSRPYMVMELLRGRSLADEIRARKRLTPEQTLVVLAQATAALEAAHAAGVIHRDLKSDNIFVDAKADGWNVTLLDFGLAKREGSAGPNLTNPGTVMGTPAYMAPEQIRGGGEVTPKTDVYSLGIVAWTALTGREPWLEGTLLDVMGHHLDTVAPPITAQEVPAGLAALVAEMLEKDPARRPTAEQVRVRVRQLQRAAAPASKSSRRATALALGAVALVGAALAGVGWWVNAAPPPPVELPEEVRVPRPIERLPLPPMEVVEVEPPRPPPVAASRARWPCAKVMSVGPVEPNTNNAWYVMVVELENESNLVVTAPFTKKGKKDMARLRDAVAGCRKTPMVLQAEQTKDQPRLWTASGGYRGVGVEAANLSVVPPG